MINVNNSVNKSSPREFLSTAQNLSTHHDRSTVEKLWIRNWRYGLERLRCVAEPSYRRQRGHEAGRFVLLLGTLSNLEGYSVRRFKGAPGDLDARDPWNCRMSESL